MDHNSPPNALLTASRCLLRLSINAIYSKTQNLRYQKVTIMASSTILPLYLLLALSFDNHAEASCSLCQTNIVPTRINCILDENSGLKCGDLFPQLLLNQDEAECLEYQTKYQEKCCGDKTSIELCAKIDPAEDSSSTIQLGERINTDLIGETGNEPICELCYSTNMTSLPGCAEYYNRGLNGLIPKNVCPALQQFAKDACGCGDAENTVKEEEDYSSFENEVLEPIREKGYVLLMILIIAAATLTNYVIFLLRHFRRERYSAEKTGTLDFDLDI